MSRQTEAYFNCPHCSLRCESAVDRLAPPLTKGYYVCAQCDKAFRYIVSYRNAYPHVTTMTEEVYRAIRTN